MYERESVSRSQIDIKRKRWKKQHLFLDISSTNIDTPAPLHYQCFETRRIEVFWLLSQPLPHLVCHHLRLSNGLERISRPSCEPVYATNTSHRKQETLLYEYCLYWDVLPTETHNRTLLFGIILLKDGRQVDNWNQPLNTSMRACYLGCHETGQGCYVVMHIENLLRRLQLFYSICDLFTDPPS
jgi:hypothetical protein